MSDTFSDLKDIARNFFWLSSTAACIGALMTALIAVYPKEVYATITDIKEEGIRYQVTAEFYADMKSHSIDFYTYDEYEIGDNMHLYATEDYSTFTDSQESRAVSKFMNSVFSGAKVIGSICASIAGLMWLLFSSMEWLDDTDDDKLRRKVKDIRKIASRCTSKPYRKTLLTIIRELNTQVVALEKDKEVVVPETEHIYKEKRKALKQTIKEVRALASEAVLEMNSNTSEEALQMAIYKLQAYKELK